nr:hypothetical protein CTI12_AA518330 [Tanacetum cinerariifolium]
MHLGGEVDDKPYIVLDDSCTLQCDCSLSLMGKAQDFGSLSNLKIILAKEGFDNLILKYLGGFWVQIDCRSKHALEKFKSHVGVRSWFSTLQQASSSLLIDERVAWVDIEGVPLNAWTINTFTKITSKWGKLLYEDDKENLCLNSKRDEDVEDESGEEIMDVRSKEGDSNLNKNNTPEGDSDIDEVPETIFDHDHEMPKQTDDEKDDNRQFSSLETKAKSCVHVEFLVGIRVLIWVMVLFVRVWNSSASSTLTFADSQARLVDSQFVLGSKVLVRSLEV